MQLKTKWMSNCSNWGCWGCFQAWRRENWGGDLCGCWNCSYKCSVLTVFSTYTWISTLVFLIPCLAAYSTSSFLATFLFIPSANASSIFSVLIVLLNYEVHTNLHPNGLNAMFGSIFNIIGLNKIHLHLHIVFQCFLKSSINPDLTAFSASACIYTPGFSMPFLTTSSVSAIFSFIPSSNASSFWVLEAGMNGNVDTEDVVDKVDQTSSNWGYWGVIRRHNEAGQCWNSSCWKASGGETIEGNVKAINLLDEASEEEWLDWFRFKDGHCVGCLEVCAECEEQGDG